LLGGTGKSVRLWDTTTWQPIGPPLQHPAAFSVVVLSQDGTLALTAGGREARLWRLATGTLLGPPLTHQANILAATFSPDGRTVATGSEDNTARLWRVATREPISRPLHHWARVTALAFSPDGRTLLTSSGENQARFWDTATGEPLGPPLAAGHIKSLVSSPDGQGVILAGGTRGRKGRGVYSTWDGRNNEIYIWDDRFAGWPSATRWDLPPRPLECEAARLALWAQVITNRNLDDANVPGWLSPQTWKECRQRLEKRGGSPAPPEDGLAWHRREVEACFREGYLPAALWHLEVLLAAEPKQWQHHYSRGRARAGSKQDEQAVADFSRAIALGAEGPEVWRLRGEVHARLLQWDKAAADYRAAIERGADFRAWCSHADACLEARHTDAYRRACAELLERFGPNRDPAIAYAVTKSCLKAARPGVDPARLLPLAERALAGSSVISNSGGVYRRNCAEMLALVLYRACRFEAAIQCLNEGARGTSPQAGPSQAHLLLLAMAQQRLGRQEQARGWLTQAVAATSQGILQFYPWLREEAEALIGLHLSLADAHYRLGLSFAKSRNWDGAIARFKEAIKLKPDFSEAHFNLGLALHNQHKLDQAITAYRKAIDLNPNEAGYHNNLGIALHRQGEWEDLLLLGLRTLGLMGSPVGHGPFFAASALILGRPKVEQAIAAYRRALTLNPHLGAAHYNLYIVWLQQGQVEEAITALGKVVDLEPNHALRHNELAWLLANYPNTKCRNPKRAVDLAKKAVVLNPKAGDYWNTLGSAHYRAGSWKEAITALHKAMELRRGGDAFDWYFLAMAQWRLGNAQEARGWYQRAVAWTDRHQPANEELRRFQSEAADLLRLNEKKD
jgi:tetratricopeptide (TPR) repeat protein